MVHKDKHELSRSITKGKLSSIATVDSRSNRCREKFDVKLQQLLEARNLDKYTVNDSNCLASDKSNAIPVIVGHSTNQSSLEATGLEITSFGSSFATGMIGLESIIGLAELEHVGAIELSVSASFCIDKSMAEIRVLSARSNVPPHEPTPGVKPYTGKGVIVGLMDGGFDESLEDFQHPNPSGRFQDARTRAVGIWDMGASKASLEHIRGEVFGPPQGKQDGIYFNETMINKIIRGQYGLLGVRMKGQTGHGSHVAGIAAGSGRKKIDDFYQKNKFSPYQFVGVAPEADILFCDISITEILDQKKITDAVHFMFETAEERDQACVVNLSLGVTKGARDGTSLFEQAIDSALIKNGQPVPGRAVVVGMGNERQEKRHSRKLVSAQANVSFEFHTDITTDLVSLRRGRDTPSQQLAKIEIWYNAPASFRVGLETPSKYSGVASGQTNVSPNDPLFSDRGFTILSKRDPGAKKGSILITLGSPFPFGRWRINLTEINGFDANVDAWIDPGGTDFCDNPFFPGWVNVWDNTITAPAAAKTVIAVGAYNSSKYTTGNKYQSLYGELCEFSGQGLDSSYGVSDEEVRPHIVAPGRHIVSLDQTVAPGVASAALMSSKTFGGLWPMYYGLHSGTSMAAPHVTGVVALMFQKNKNLNHVQIREILKATASKDSIPGSYRFPNSLYGFGKLDAAAALAAVPTP
jgi:subtilisin family serine protease